MGEYNTNTFDETMANTIHIKSNIHFTRICPFSELCRRHPNQEIEKSFHDRYKACMYIK